jgi:hypothetical protein
MRNSQALLIENHTRECPQCRGTLVFKDHHPTLTVTSRLVLTGSEVADRIRYERAWVCLSARCDYRQIVGTAG